MQIDRAKAEKTLDRAAELATHAAISKEWATKVSRLWELCEKGKTRTHLALLVTSMLAKACNVGVDLIALKPTHAEGNEDAYSARSLCESVIVAGAARHGFSIGVTGREPLNNQPYFRMDRLDDGTPVSKRGRPAFDYNVNLVRELQQSSESEAMAALVAYIAVSRTKIVTYADIREGIEIQSARLAKIIAQFVAEDSEGGRRAQAVVAGLLDVFAIAKKVDSGRINDPSRKYPGDVCIRSADGQLEKAFEVRDKPVSVSDVFVFGQKCLSFGVQEAAVVMVSPKQQAIDVVALQSWAEENRIGITLFFTWADLVQQILFWAGEASPQAAKRAITCIQRRLIAVEASPQGVERWLALAGTT